MLGDRLLQHLNQGEKTSFIGQIEETKINQLLQQKDKQIKQLKKTIKKLTKQLKQKSASQNIPKFTQSGNFHFKILLQREINRCNDLKEIVVTITDRIKRLMEEMNQQFSQSKNNESIEKLVKMLQMENIEASYSKNRQVFERKQSYSGSSDQIIEIDRAMDQLEVIAKKIAFKFSQNNKLLKQALQKQRQLQQQVALYKKELKDQKKSTHLLQKLLQKSQHDKNDLLNQIINISEKKQLQDIKNRTKQEILQYCFKQGYRIKDLEKEKQDLIKSSTRDKQKQFKLYEALWKQVKGIQEKSQLRRSIA